MKNSNKLFFLYAFPNNLYHLLSGRTSWVLLFFIILFLKVHVAALSVCCGFCLCVISCPYLGEVCFAFGKHCAAKEAEMCRQGREGSKVIELYIDTGFF